MSTPVNTVLYWLNQNFVATSEKTSRVGEFIGVQGVIFYFTAKDESGIYNIDVRVDSDDDWVELAEGTAEADKLTVVDVDFYIPEARIRFTPDAVPMSLTVKAFGYPCVYTRLVNDDRPCRKDPSLPLT